MLFLLIKDVFRGLMGDVFAYNTWKLQKTSNVFLFVDFRLNEFERWVVFLLKCNIDEIFYLKQIE